MFSLPSSRHFVLPALLIFAIFVIFRLADRVSVISLREAFFKAIIPYVQTGHKISVDVFEQRFLVKGDISASQTFPVPQNYYTYTGSRTREAAQARYLERLFVCNTKPDPVTNHIRLPNLLRNVSQTPPFSPPDPNQKFNPTIIALPYWSKNHYLLISRVVTEGLHQHSLICEANICHDPSLNISTTDSKPCSTDDQSTLGFSGGLRCATQAVMLNVPPTPAEQCYGQWTAFPDIPGFHDPRAFWSGKGEPLIIVNSASRYACLGLWIVDLRTLYAPLQQILTSDPENIRDGKGIEAEVRGEGPLMSYPHLTELTRNPPGSRASVEKNWMLFFPTYETAYVHYDILRDGAIRGGRSFAKLIGNGFATENLTDPEELPCLGTGFDGTGRVGHWHQASNALKLILCTRMEVKEGMCDDVSVRAVHFAIVHRKFSNNWELPLRYERWLMVWDAQKPFHMLAVSRFPILFWNETVSGFSEEENPVPKDGSGIDASELSRTNVVKRAVNQTQMVWHNKSKSGYTQEQSFAYFTYTPSIAWVWRPKSTIVNGQEKEYLHGLNVGYLDDEIIVGIGMDDTGQGFAKAKALDLLQCMRACPKAHSTKNMPDDDANTEEEDL